MKHSDILWTMQRCMQEGTTEMTTQCVADKVGKELYWTRAQLKIMEAKKMVKSRTTGKNISWVIV